MEEREWILMELKFNLFNEKNDDFKLKTNREALKTPQAQKYVTPLFPFPKFFCSILRCVYP